MLSFLADGHQQGYAGSKTLHQWNPPVLNWRCRLMQIDLYNGSKTVVVVVVLLADDLIWAASVLSILIVTLLLFRQWLLTVLCIGSYPVIHHAMLYCMFSVVVTVLCFAYLWWSRDNLENCLFFCCLIKILIKASAKLLLFYY